MRPERCGTRPISLSNPLGFILVGIVLFVPVSKEEERLESRSSLIPNKRTAAVSSTVLTTLFVCPFDCPLVSVCDQTVR